ncbi:hypothetical protein THOM_0535 [Trachipleistophora hominis]|uniref:Uncharacterized protein n=1 Tax=Trachipleistophora hominis TaxID=72359 RepID=L7K082_TRAHO|nr:hypothetical protein THOM_0535 [Trachipleistophora hominis]
MFSRNMNNIRYYGIFFSHLKYIILAILSTLPKLAKFRLNNRNKINVILKNHNLIYRSPPFSSVVFHA